MAASNTYLGLYIGLTVSVSIPSAIIAITVLKPLGTTPQEVNAVQVRAYSSLKKVKGIVLTGGDRRAAARAASSPLE